MTESLPPTPTAPSAVSPAVSPDAFRDVLRHFAAGVTLVTSRWGEVRHGMTVSAFSSVSAEPPLVAVMIDRAHSINPLLAADGACYAVNILAEDQEELSNRFAFEKDEDRFLEGDWGLASTGAPVLRDALAWLDCRVVGRHVAGSHTIYLGAVEASRVTRDGDATRPLVYWNRAYRRLSDPHSTP